MKKPLRVMKFGGTSVGDASCIARVAQIVKEASREGPIVAVVSAMSGVTNRLIEAATQAEAGEQAQAGAIFAALRKQHEAALSALIHEPKKRTAHRGLSRANFSTRASGSAKERRCSAN